MTTALLIDITGIQDYIFSGNSLAENLGASHIIRQGIRDVLKEQIDESNGGLTEYTFKEEYFGGGNALITYSKKENQPKNTLLPPPPNPSPDKDPVKDFIRNFSFQCLARYPGLKPVFAIKERYIGSPNGFSISHKELHRILQHNKQQGQLPRVPYKSGATADCPLSGEAASIYHKDENAYISSLSYAKLKEAENANEAQKILLPLDTTYKFTNQLGKLGQPDESGYIAIVHIDGNGMGELFRNRKDLDDLKNLSKKVDNAINNAAKAVINMVVEKIMPQITKDKDLEFSQFGNRPACLPIRPIILSGDDITFVCEARLALSLTGFFIEEFKKAMDAKDTNGLSIDIGACAGISIVKEKFPFFKAYQEAAELCKQAKHTARQVKTVLDREVSLLSWNIITRNQEQQAVQAQLPDRSGLWQVLPQEAITAPGIQGSLEGLIDGAQWFVKWPKSQLIRLRNCLYEEDRKAFDALIKKAAERGWGKDKKNIEELDEAGKIKLDEAWRLKFRELLPDFSPNTRLMLKDMIEMIDFYPSFLKPKGK